jgi:hypothetical protein
MLRSKVKLEFQVKLYIEIVKIHQCTKIFELGSAEILLLEWTRFCRKETKKLCYCLCDVCYFRYSHAFLLLLSVFVGSSFLLFALLHSFSSFPFLFCPFFPPFCFLYFFFFYRRFLVSFRKERKSLPLLASNT